MKKSLLPLICTASVLALLLTGCAESSDTKAGASSSQTFSPSEGDGADDTADEDAPAFENGILTTPEVRIEITRYKVIKAGQKGNEYGDMTPDRTRPARTHPCDNEHCPGGCLHRDR